MAKSLEEAGVQDFKFVCSDAWFEIESTRDGGLLNKLDAAKRILLPQKVMNGGKPGQNGNAKLIHYLKKNRIIIMTVSLSP